MGLGKTVEAIVLDLERRKELPYDAEPKTLIVTPLPVVSSWVNHYNTWAPSMRVVAIDNKNRIPFSRDALYGIGDIFICHWPALRLMPELAERHWFHLILDECVIAGTEISTPSRNTKIEDLKIGDIVYGYDHNTNKIVESRVLQTFNRFTNNQLYNVNGVTMTGNHPVWTEESKYVDASTLDSMDYTLLRLAHDYSDNDLRAVPETVSVSKASKRRVKKKKILQPIMLWSRSCKNERSNRSNVNLRMVSKRIHMSKIYEGQAQVLRYEMFQYLEGSGLSQISSKNYARKFWRYSKKKYRDSSKESKTTGISSLRSKPIQQPRSSSKSTSNLSSTRLCTPNRWKWKIYNSSNCIIRSSWIRLDIRTSYSDRRSSLYDRYSKHNIQDCNRNRWCISFINNNKRARRAKGYVSSINWLDSNKIQERGSSERHGQMFKNSTRVFNIETESGNYFANGILVHNCHGLQNRKAQQTRAAKRIKADYKTGLSGTPAFDKPDDLWSILNWLYPKYWTSYWKYFNRYIHSVEYNGYKQIIGIVNVEELQQLMSGFYIRRTKEEVMPDLPEKYYTEVNVDLLPQQQRAYDSMRKTMIAWVGEHEQEPVDASVVIAQITRLQQLADAYVEVTEDGLIKLSEPSSKLDALMQLIDTNAGQLVVFSQFSQMIKLLEKRLLKAGIPHGIYIGGTPEDKRTKIIEDFQDGKLKVFAGTISAGGVGITLTASSTVIFLDRGWSPSINSQAEDRLHRYGQKNAVQIIDIVAKKTLDAKRMKQIMMKWNFIKMLIGDTEGDSLAEELDDDESYWED